MKLGSGLFALLPQSPARERAAQLQIQQQALSKTSPRLCFETYARHKPYARPEVLSLFCALYVSQLYLINLHHNDFLIPKGHPHPLQPMLATARHTPCKKKGTLQDTLSFTPSLSPYLAYLAWPWLCHFRPLRFQSQFPFSSASPDSRPPSRPSSSLC